MFLMSCSAGDANAGVTKDHIVTVEAGTSCDMVYDVSEFCYQECEVVSVGFVYPSPVYLDDVTVDIVKETNQDECANRVRQTRYSLNSSLNNTASIPLSPYAGTCKTPEYRNVNKSFYYRC